MPMQIIPVGCHEVGKFQRCSYFVKGHYVRVFYDMTKDYEPVQYTCDCPAYAMGKRCRHINILMNYIGLVPKRDFWLRSGVHA